MRMTFGALVTAGLLLASTGALAQPGSSRVPNRYDRVGRPGADTVRVVRAERPQLYRGRTTTHATTRSPRFVDQRRSRGELFGADGVTPSRSGARTTVKVAGRTASSHNPMSRRSNQVSNCSEFANCGGASAATDGSSRAKSSNSSRKDAYKAKVWKNWSKKFEAWLGPWAKRATVADDFLP